MRGQHPTTLFIGCSDSRLVPYLLTGAGPGSCFWCVTSVPLCHRTTALHGHHGTTAAIEFAVLNLQVRRIIVCGHSHRGAIKAMYGEVSPEAPTSTVGWIWGARPCCRCSQAPRPYAAQNSGPWCSSWNG